METTLIPRSRQVRGRYRHRRTLTPTTFVLSLCVYALRTTPGLVTILAGLVLAPLDHRPVAVGLVVAGSLVYAEQCKRTPYANCWRCHGIGYRTRHRSRLARWLLGPPSTRCRLCKGHGVRMRWGRRVMNAYRRATYTPPAVPDRADAASPAPAAGPVNQADALRRWHATHPDQIAPTRTPRSSR